MLCVLGDIQLHQVLNLGAEVVVVEDPGLGKQLLLRELGKKASLLHSREEEIKLFFFLLVAMWLLVTFIERVEVVDHYDVY